MVVMVARHFWRENGLKRGKENERDPDFIVVREICPLGEPGPDSFDLEGGGSLNFDSNFVFREKNFSGGLAAKIHVWKHRKIPQPLPPPPRLGDQLLLH